MRQAHPNDIATLVDLMNEFYAESDYELDRPLAEKAFADILADTRLGYVWIVDKNGKDVGYVVVTLRYGMEYGGSIACIDDLFVIPQSRNRGLSTAALLQVRDFSQDALAFAQLRLRLATVTALRKRSIVASV
ncbi:MAG: GNAT family N-acetyltransferase [Pseudanabaena sp. SU_2_4]|nr:GNAT family N-acetyltransferase [Pseudanabaena sp. SU_2_4]